MREPGRLKETQLPARRAVTFDVGLSEGLPMVEFKIWEITEDVGMQRIPLTPELSSVSSDGDGTAEGEGEGEGGKDEERTTTMVSRDHYLGGVKLYEKAAVKVKGKWKTTVDVRATKAIFE